MSADQEPAAKAVDAEIDDLIARVKVAQQLLAALQIPDGVNVNLVKQVGEVLASVDKFLPLVVQVVLDYHHLSKSLISVSKTTDQIAALALAAIDRYGKDGRLDVDAAFVSDVLKRKEAALIFGQCDGCQPPTIHLRALSRQMIATGDEDGVSVIEHAAGHA